MPQPDHWTKVQLLREIAALRRQVGALEEKLAQTGRSDHSEERFRLLFENANDAFVLEDAGERIVDANRRATTLTGYTREELLSMSMAELEADDLTGPAPHSDYITSGNTHDAAFESQLMHKSGRRIPVEVHIASLRVADEVLYLSVIRDISERLQYQERLRHLAQHDPLTGAFNRHSLDELLEREVARSRRYKRSIGFLMIDVDRFKPINDNLGHAVGDEVLVAVVSIVQSQVRTTDLVVRYGGDELLVVLPETPSRATPLRDRIQVALDRWNHTQELIPEPLTLSMGISVWHADSEEPVEAAIDRADAEMYRDKQARRAQRG